MPQDSAPVQAAENKTNFLDKNVPNPLAKNPNVHTHKVFASVALILIGTIVILSILAYFYRDQVADFFNETLGSNTTETTKVSTSSAKTATSSTAKDETADWKTYINKDRGFSIKYPPNRDVKEGENKIIHFTPSDKNNLSDLYIVEIGKFDANKTFQTLSKYTYGDKVTPEILVVGERKIAIGIVQGHPDQFFSVIIEEKGRYARLVFLLDSRYNSNQSELLNQILSTFKFL